MRLALLLCCLATPALSWVTRTEGNVCILEHDAATVDLRLSYDPVQPLYTIALTRGEAWARAGSFALRFDGIRAVTISTTRHILDDADRRLSVSDTGFGNVLDGLQFNDSATAVLGVDEITVDLTGAAPAVAAFRDCTNAPVA